MSSPWLSNLKIRVDHLVVALVSVVVVVGGLWLWSAMRADRAEDQLDAGLERMRGRTKAGPRWPGASKPRFVRGYHESARVEQGEGRAVHLPPPQVDPGDLDASEAVDAYQAVLADLEAALDSERTLGKRERAELYNRASGSLTALSAWADPNDPNDRALMDDAYLQLKSLMRELKLSPPAVDPDPAPAPW